jgi:hypothetical protein
VRSRWPSREAWISSASRTIRISGASWKTFALIADLLARTERLHFISDVANLPLRPPALLAKTAASLDLMRWTVRAPAFERAASGTRSPAWAGLTARSSMTQRAESRSTQTVGRPPTAVVDRRDLTSRLDKGAEGPTTPPPRGAERPCSRSWLQTRGCGRDRNLGRGRMAPAGVREAGDRPPVVALGGGARRSQHLARGRGAAETRGPRRRRRERAGSGDHVIWVMTSHPGWQQCLSGPAEPVLAHEPDSVGPTRDTTVHSPRQPRPPQIGA